jgi:hypothetical protein
MKIENANNLKPKANEISHIQNLMFNEKFGKNMVHQWSVYLLDGKYHLAKGKLFHEKQNHEVVMSNKDYKVIAKFLTNSK